jgi:hypothetical protein
MRQRQRKLVGTVAMLVLVAGWALFANALVPGRIAALAAPWQLLVYGLLGFGWVVPAGALIWWMQRPDPERN